MIPLRDVIPSRTVPFLTISIIVVNALAWFYELGLPREELPVFLRQFGVVPAYFSPPTLITSMFLHGSWSHVLGNMWYLWIFGDNVEDRMGHFRFLIFYLLCGIIAALGQILIDPTSTLPTIGASGAIAGVMGAYFILFPSARVLTWFFVFFLWLPAWVMLGYWFVVQFLTGAANAISSTATGGGVAFGAHVGGFIAGVIMIKLLPLRPRRYRYGH